MAVYEPLWLEDPHEPQEALEALMAEIVPVVDPRGEA